MTVRRKRPICDGVLRNLAFAKRAVAMPQVTVADERSVPTDITKLGTSLAQTQNLACLRPITDAVIEDLDYALGNPDASIES